MIRIAITAEGFEAIAATLPLGSVTVEAEANERGERVIWAWGRHGGSARRDAGAGRDLMDRARPSGRNAGHLRPNSARERARPVNA